MKRLLSERYRFQIVAERAAEVMPVEGQFHRCFQEAEFISGVESLAFKFEAVNRTVPQHVFQSIRELNFSAAAGFNRLDTLEDLGR